MVFDIIFLLCMLRYCFRRELLFVCNVCERRICREFVWGIIVLLRLWVLFLRFLRFIFLIILSVIIFFFNVGFLLVGIVRVMLFKLVFMFVFFLGDFKLGCVFLFLVLVWCFLVFFFVDVMLICGWGIVVLFVLLRFSIVICIDIDFDCLMILVVGSKVFFIVVLRMMLEFFWLYNGIFLKWGLIEVLWIIKIVVLFCKNLYKMNCI